MGKNLKWRVNTPALLNEVLENASCSILSKPLAILGHILGEVGARAAELNDPQLNALMMRLAIYEVSDPYSPNYDEKIVRKCLKDADQ